MASRRYGRVFPTSTQVLTKTQLGAAKTKFGTLVYQGATEGSVIPATGTGQNIIGIALADDVKANQNTTSAITGSGAEYYSSGDSFAVEPLIKGQDYWVWCGETGNIAINTYLNAGADGTVVNPAATTTPTIYSLFQALEVGTGTVDSGWFRARAI